MICLRIDNEKQRVVCGTLLFSLAIAWTLTYLISNDTSYFALFV